MKILVTGASGLLGRELVSQLLLDKENSVIALYNRNPIPIKHKRLIKIKIDITYKTLLEDLLFKLKPDVIVHAAAYTDVDGCEINRHIAWNVNVEATKSIMKIAKVIKSYVIYISTDYVFDGNKGLYSEQDVPNPVNFYGLTKLISEEIVRSSGIFYTIVRPSAIYGFGGRRKSFAEYVIENLRKNSVVRALIDQYVSPIYNVLLAKALTEVMNLRPMGTIHIAGEWISRYEFAKKMAKIFNLPTKLIKKTKMANMKTWIAKRPKDSSLNIEKAKRIIKTRFHNIDYALKLLKGEWEKRKR